MRSGVLFTLTVLFSALVVGSDVPLRLMSRPGRSSRPKSEGTGPFSRLLMSKCLPFVTAAGCAIRSTRLSCRARSEGIATFGSGGPRHLAPARDARLDWLAANP